MAQILDPIPSGQVGHILCCYVNATSKIQIARITNISNWYFERVVFPGQRLVFESFPEAVLEIHTGMMASAILSDKIPCNRLCIRENTDVVVETTQEAKTTEKKFSPSLESPNKARGAAKPLIAAALTSVD